MRRVDRAGSMDWRGPVVQGKRGERFVYLTWVSRRPDGSFEMFRRAKLMLDRVDPAVLEEVGDDGRAARRGGAHRREGRSALRAGRPTGYPLVCGLNSGGFSLYVGASS